MALHNGVVVAGRYRLQRLIATGGMGQVWEATDTRLDRRVAVKVLKAEFTDDPEFLARFRAEARTTAQLNHPGIAGIYDYGETKDPDGHSTAYLVMELVNGEPLNAVLSRVGRLSLPHALDMLEQTGRALQVAHDAGVVHRDVKPGNILITPTGQVKITDFGIAKAVDASPITRTGMVMGTAQYIAPEQALGQDATAASDVYALGVVGYEVLSGRRPFLGDGVITVAMKHVRETPAPMPEDLPAPIRELIGITLSKDPTARYASGGEFADAVAAVRAGHQPPLPGHVPPPSGAGRVLPPGVAGTPTSGTRIMPTERRSYTGPPAGPPTGGNDSYTGPDPTSLGNGNSAQKPQKKSLTGGQKALAWSGGGLLVLAVLATLGVLLLGGDNAAPVPAPATTTTTVKSTTTTPPTTTTRPPRTTTAEAPPPWTTTTIAPPVTTVATPPTTTTEPIIPPTAPPITTIVPVTPTTVPVTPTTTTPTPTATSTSTPGGYEKPTPGAHGEPTGPRRPPAPGAYEQPGPPAAPTQGIS